MEGSTRLWESQPDAMRAALERHDEILNEVFAEHDGFVFSTAGDGFGAAFGRAGDALAAALGPQDRFGSEAWPEALPVAVRMGIHTGEVHPPGKTL